MTRVRGRTGASTRARESYTGGWLLAIGVWLSAIGYRLLAWRDRRQPSCGTVGISSDSRKPIAPCRTGDRLLPCALPDVSHWRVNAWRGSGCGGWTPVRSPRATPGHVSAQALRARRDARLRHPGRRRSRRRCVRRTMPAQRSTLRPPQPHEGHERRPLPLLLHRLRQTQTLRVPRRRHRLQPAGTMLQRRVRAGPMLRDVHRPDRSLRAGGRHLLPLRSGVRRESKRQAPRLLLSRRLPVRPALGLLQRRLRPPDAPLPRPRS